MNATRTVLVVDDDWAVLRALQQRLEQAGCRVLTATDGAAALASAGRWRPDAVCLDVHLPGAIDGLEVARRLHVGSRVGPPVIFITGAADQDFRERCAAVGGRYFLTKPYDPELLIQTLRSVFAEDELAELRRISNVKRRQPIG